MSTLPGKGVTKYIFCILTFWSLVMYGQTIGTDLESKSVQLLQTKIDYVATKSSLKEALKSLGFDNNINILFSSTTLGETKASPVVSGKMELGPLLSLLLKDTGFDYVVVGKSIAIVENLVKPVANDSGQVSAPTSKALLQTHIISEKTKSFEHVPKKDRRMVRSLLLKELHNYGLELEEGKDTIIVKPIEDGPRYGIALSGGYLSNNIKTRSLVSYDWRTELRYQQKTSPTFLLCIQGILFQKGYFVFAGLNFHRLITETSWVEMKKNGAQVELPSTSKAEKVTYLNAKDRLSLLSIPLGVGHTFKLYRKHSLAPTLSFDLFAVLSSHNSNLNKFKDYVSIKESQAIYTEKTKSIGLSSTLSLRYSYTYKRHYAFGADLGYKLGLSPVMTNTIFKSSYRGLFCTVGAQIHLPYKPVPVAKAKQ